ncbi:hypothetical protein [Litorimonas sp. WD9-15]|uniref:hypothetical protein n=1 Tax=Litorimonas sp. WD9-15 TaxID=3418716 RepID=UPI003D06C4FB
MSHLKSIDHVTYACAAGTIEKWAWFHIEVEGGTLIKRIDDVNPDGKSSMKIWCIDYGNFGIALIEGIDREEKSQVTAFVDKHGDHSCQHVAYDCYSLDKFIDHMKTLGGHPRGDVIIQDDGFGILKQMFAKGFASGHAGEATFPEYCERPRNASEQRDMEITFSEMAGEGFYAQVQKAIEENDTTPFFDFKKMPGDWEVPPVQEKVGKAA